MRGGWLSRGTQGGGEPLPGPEAQAGGGRGWAGLRAFGIDRGPWEGGLGRAREGPWPGAGGTC